MAQTIIVTCSDCGASVVEDDNRVWLDTPAVEWDGGRAQWTLMRLGSLLVASAGDPDVNGMAHTLHEHQPPNGAMAS